MRSGQRQRLGKRDATLCIVRRPKYKPAERKGHGGRVRFAYYTDFTMTCSVHIYIIFLFNIQVIRVNQLKVAASVNKHAHNIVMDGRHLFSCNTYYIIVGPLQYINAHSFQMIS